MNTKLIIIGLLVILIMSCNHPKGNNRSQELLKNDSITIVNVERERLEKKRKDSIIEIEQNKVIGDITFGMSDKEFTSKFEKFRKENKYENFIGEYEYLQILDYYDKGKLYELLIQGKLINWEYYDSEVAKQIKNITDVLKQKYGEPSIHNDLEPRYKLEKGYTYLINRWIVGKKTIEVKVEADETNYLVDVSIFLSDVKDKLERENEKKEKESTENAKNVF